MSKTSSSETWPIAPWNDIKYLLNSVIRVRNTLVAKVVISPFANIAELTQNQGRVACVISSLAIISRTGGGGDVALLWMGSCMCVVCICLRSIIYCLTVKPVLSGHSKGRPKLFFKTDYRFMQVKSIAECSKRAFRNIFDFH